MRRQLVGESEAAAEAATEQQGQHDDRGRDCAGAGGSHPQGCGELLGAAHPLPVGASRTSLIPRTRGYTSHRARQTRSAASHPRCRLGQEWLATPPLFLRSSRVSNRHGLARYLPQRRPPMANDARRCSDCGTAAAAEPHFPRFDAGSSQYLQAEQPRCPVGNEPTDGQ